MPKQIGWSNESNLLYQISQQITRLINVTGTNGGGSITGSGTANYITRWTSSSSLNNSVIYQSSTGNIGIGTTTPSRKLDVNGNVSFSGSVYAQYAGEVVASFGNSAGTSSTSSLIIGNAGYDYTTISAIRLSGNFATNLSFSTANSGLSTQVEAMRISENQNLLIGITNDSGLYKLNVSGSTRIVGNMSVGSNGSAIPAYINGIYALDGLSQFKQINVSNGCITFNEGTAAICGYSSSPGGVLTDYITINTNSVEQIRVLTNGNVGIGTSTPSQKLDVNGNIKGSYIIADNDLYGSNVRVNAFYANTLTYIPFNSNVSPYVEIMRMQNDGNVLIGTTTTNGFKLNVQGSGRFLSKISIDNTSSGGETLLYFGHSNLLRAKIGYVTSGMPVLENNVLFGQIIFDDNGNLNMVSRSNNPSGIRFHTTLNTTSGYNEAARFENDGSLLIGTTTNINNVKLKVNGEQEWSNITLGTGAHTTSNNHLPIWVNGVKYWLALLNPTP